MLQPAASARAIDVVLDDDGTSDGGQSTASLPPARGGCGGCAESVRAYLRSRECRSDAATAVILVMLLVLVGEHYYYRRGMLRP